MPASTHDMLQLQSLWESHFSEPMPQEVLSSGHVVANSSSGQGLDDRLTPNTDQEITPSSERLAVSASEQTVTAGSDEATFAAHGVKATIERDRERESALAATSPQGIETRGAPAKDALDRPPLPAFVARHFVAKDGRFFFKQRPEKLAFDDRGGSLRAVVDSQQVATALAEMAATRRWVALRVRGSHAFRRAVWLAAAERGIEVSGYRPKEGELALLGQRRSPRSYIPHAQRPESSRIEGRERLVHRLAGQVVAHGHAPYRNESSGSPSYYVSLRNADGEVTTHWDVDLERVMCESGIQTGDAVEFARRGKQRVEDTHGQVVDTSSKELERNAWSVTRVKRSKEAGRGTSKPTDDPVLLKAVAFFEKRFAELSDEQRVLIRERFRVLFDQIYPQVATEKAAKEALPPGEARLVGRRSGPGMEL